jgi:hypothetical protein
LIESAQTNVPWSPPAVGALATPAHEFDPAGGRTLANEPAAKLKLPPAQLE